MTIQELIDLVQGASDEECEMLRNALGTVGDDDVPDDDAIRNIAEDVVEKSGLSAADVEAIVQDMLDEQLFNDLPSAPEQKTVRPQ